MKLKTKLLLPVIALASANCEAFDWLFKPNFGASERYTDNLRMQPNPDRDSWVTTLSPGVLLGYITENQSLNTTFKWNELIYHGQSELDFSEKIADLNYEFAGERFKAGLTGRYAEQSTLNTTIQLTTDDLFTLQAQVPRTTRSISPNFLYNLTERDALQLVYDYTDVSYDASIDTISNNRAFTDYDNQQWSSTFIHTFTERFSVNLTGAYAIFNNSGQNPPGTTFKVIGPFRVPGTVTSNYSQNASTITYQAGFQYAYDERTKLSFSAGIRDTDTQIDNFITTDYSGLLPTESINIPQSFKSSGNVFSGSFKRIFDWGSIDLSGGQQLAPSSNNGQFNTTNFGADARYKLSERWISKLAIDYIETERSSSQAAGFSNNNRTSISFTPSIQWLWTPELNLQLSYSLRQLQISSPNDNIESNNVQLQFSYQPQINRQVK